MRFAPALLCFAALLAACDDDTTEAPPPDARLPDAAVDGARPDADRDAAPPADAAPDATPDAVVDAAVPDAAPCDEPPACEDRERLVGCACYPVVDRRCLGDADCRPGERCEGVMGSATRVCMFTPPPLRACPGPDCAADDDPVLYAGAASRVVTPDGFETPTPAGLDGSHLNFAPPFTPGLWNDCGRDGLCPGDDGYVAPDEGEGDGEMQGMWLAGFSTGRPAQYCPEELIGCDRPECCVSKFAHDDLKVQIAVVRQRGVTVAFAALDAVGYFHTDIDRIRARVEPMGIDLLVMGASHDHEAPDTAGQWGPGDGVPVRTGREAAFMDKIEEQTVAGIEEALAAMVPATVRAGVVDTGVDGLAISDSRTPYIFNDDLPIVHLAAVEDGRSIATVISFGNHAEVLWSDNPYITADYFHFTRKYVAEGLAGVTAVDGADKPALEGTDGVVVMFAGSVGGLINPGQGGAKDYAGVEYPEETFATADAVGQTLASHVLAGLADGRVAPVETDGLRFATRQFLVPVQNQTFRLAAVSLDLIQRDVYNVALLGGRMVPGDPYVLSQVAAVRLGPITFFTAPGEVFPETLVGGLPGRNRARTPVIGDVSRHRVDYICGADGLPVEGGDQPCIVKPDAENPPDWAAAPEGPVVYELIPGEVPFFIGLGMDFLGYMVPDYDFEASPLPFTEAPGDHYEETNSIGGTISGLWRTHLEEALDALR
ncbi:MAG: hypothetical protein H6703_03165 [Myxococcales bacterium]|nr:hypothetical protein [Myxococcales bacterium]